LALFIVPGVDFIQSFIIGMLTMLQKEIGEYFSDLSRTFYSKLHQNILKNVFFLMIIR